MKVSVIILNWNGLKLLRKFLPYVIEHTPPDVAEIVVADNGSTDGSVDALRNEFPSVRLMVFDENYGFAEGYNKVMAKICAPYSVLLNSDVEVSAGWLDAPLAFLESKPRVAAVQPKILSWHDKTRFEYAGAAGGFLDIYGYPYCRGRIFTAIEKDNGQYDNNVDVLWATGACLFVRTDVYMKEGGFDAFFFAHQEEIDFCWRLRARGYRIVCTPQSTVYHVGGGTLGVESPHKTFLNFRNNLLMIYKNLPDKVLGRVMRVRWWLDMLAAVKFLLESRPSNAAAVLRAHRAFRLIRRAYLETRKENLQQTVVRDIPEISRKSILSTFYLKGKRRFSEI